MKAQKVEISRILPIRRISKLKTDFNYPQYIYKLYYGFGFYTQRWKSID